MFKSCTCLGGRAGLGQFLPLSCRDFHHHRFAVGFFFQLLGMDEHHWLLRWQKVPSLLTPRAAHTMSALGEPSGGWYISIDIQIPSEKVLNPSKNTPVRTSSRGVWMPRVCLKEELDF